MEIKSNTLGKLNKIREGKVFTEPLTFIKEFIQNCQRSKASILNINIENDYIEFIDNGCGCKKPSNVFTLDLSDWDSTKEGFGIGFWSCLNIPCLTKIEVSSHNWTGVVDINNLFLKGDLKVDMIYKSTPISGFKVKLYSCYFKEHESNIYSYTKDTAKYIDSLYVSINNEASICHEKILDTFNPCEYCKIYENRYFTAKLSLDANGYSYINTFYDKRKVREFYDFDYISGVLEFKKDKITLKEPDRTSFVRDDKYYAFKAKLEECIKDFYKSYISIYGIDNEDAIDGIAYYLSVKDYEKYLELDLEDDVIEKEFRNSKEKEIEVVYDDSEIVISQISAKKTNTSEIIINKRDFYMPDTTSKNYFKVPSKKNNKKATKNNISKLLPQLKKCVWVSGNEQSYYEELIAKAKYCNIKIIVAKNRLYESALKSRSIMHISQINDCLEEFITKKNIELKTTKEEIFIKLLQPICEKYNLNLDIFKIANLEKITTFKIDGKTLYKEVSKNKKGSIKTYGLTDGYNIYLDRTALELSKFNIHDSRIGIHELKAIINSVNTIAHELAHYLYGTVDNTIEHYNKEIKLQEEIINLYL